MLRAVSAPIQESKRKLIRRVLSLVLPQKSHISDLPVVPAWTDSHEAHSDTSNLASPSKYQMLGKVAQTSPMTGDGCKMDWNLIEQPSAMHRSIN